MAETIVLDLYTPELRDPPQATDRGCPPETPEQLAAARERDQALYDYMIEYFGVTEGGDLVVRKWRGRNSLPVGSITGSVDSGGYLATWVLGKRRLNHHLTWLLHFGRLPMPSLDIDHIDQCRSNNRVENLREASRQFNCLNRKDNDDTLPYGLIRAIMGGGRNYIQANIQHPGTRKNVRSSVRIKPWAMDASHGHPRGWAINADGTPIRAADELQAIETLSAWWCQQQQALYGQAT